MDVSKILTLMDKVVELEEEITTVIKELKEDTEDSIAKTKSIGYMKTLNKQINVFKGNEFELLYVEDLITINEKTSSTNNDTDTDNT